jgi:hypothetical protein
VKHFPSGVRSLWPAVVIAGCGSPIHDRSAPTVAREKVEVVPDSKRLKDAAKQLSRSKNAAKSWNRKIAPDTTGSENKLSLASIPLDILQEEQESVESMRGEIQTLLQESAPWSPEPSTLTEQEATTAPPTKGLNVDEMFVNTPNPLSFGPKDCPIGTVIFPGRNACSEFGALVNDQGVYGGDDIISERTVQICAIYSADPYTHPDVTLPLFESVEFRLVQNYGGFGKVDQHGSTRPPSVTSFVPLPSPLEAFGYQGWGPDSVAVLNNVALFEYSDGMMPLLASIRNNTESGHSQSQYIYPESLTSATWIDFPKQKWQSGNEPPPANGWRMS